MIPVNAIEQKENGEIRFNLASDAANTDFIRAARLTKKQIEKLEKEEMYVMENKIGGDIA